MTDESTHAETAAEVPQPDSAASARHKSEQQLRYRRLLRDHFDDVIEVVTRTIHDNKEKQVSRSQLASVIAVAQESRSVLVVVGFIQYQMSRPGSDWNREDNRIPKPQWLGSYIVARLENEIKTLAQELAGSGLATQRELHIDLTQLYLGYLRRAFIASGQTRGR
jgi:hypothetical protein